MQADALCDWQLDPLEAEKLWSYHNGPRVLSVAQVAHAIRADLRGPVWSSWSRGPGRGTARAPGLRRSHPRWGRGPAAVICGGSARCVSSYDDVFDAREMRS